jgi:hypothetical protein
MRDAVLAAAGTIDPKRPARSPAQELKMSEMQDSGPEARGLRTHAAKDIHRSVYLPLVRGVIPASLEAFDPVEQSLVTGSRDATTVPGQALYLLNSPFVRHHALVLSDRLLADKDASESSRIEAAYRRILGRSPAAKEVERATTYLKDYEEAYHMGAAESPKKAPADEGDVLPKNDRSAAWMSFTQALIASAEFRYLR